METFTEAAVLCNQSCIDCNGMMTIVDVNDGRHSVAVDAASVVLVEFRDLHVGVHRPLPPPPGGVWGQRQGKKLMRGGVMGFLVDLRRVFATT